MKFRKDINGLRAMAVIAVLLFHFNASWMPGGFAGVDVFFVISGFLMTGIIFRGMEQNNFSILNFYVARANRIIPAMALLCLVLIVFGWFYFTPIEYEELGKHTASSVGFISNFIYWREAGYFDAASHEKWLLHTWSLSVEWQFYIIYPIILLSLRKFFSIKNLKLLLIAGTVLGFIFSVIVTYKLPNAAYYLFPTRAWEMMIGGVAYLYPFTLQDNRKKVVEFTGITLIIASYFLISAENLWPGYLAIFPVLGSFLIIQAQRNDSFLTGNIVFQKLGAWSYSIYLWHWPLVVAIYTFLLPDHFIYIGIVLSVLLGFLSYKYVERIKFSTQFNSFSDYLNCKPIYIFMFVSLLGGVIYVKYESLTKYRLSSEQIAITEQQQRDPRISSCDKVENGMSEGCVYGVGPIKAIVIGDSHAFSLVSEIGNKAQLNDGSIISFAISACPTIKNVVYRRSENLDYNCGKLVSNVIDIARKDYPNIPIIIVNRLSMYLHGQNEVKDSELLPPDFWVEKIFYEKNSEYINSLTDNMISTICEFSKNNPVYLIRPTPEFKDNVPKNMFKSLVLNKNNSAIKMTRKNYDERQRKAFKMQDEAVERCGAKVLDPIPYLCNNEYCYGDINGIPLYFDDDHLSNYGSKTISPIYDEIFDKS